MQTNGVTEFITEEKLKEILLDKETNQDNYLKKLEDQIIQVDNSGAKEKYIANDKDHSDDIGSFLIQVP